MKYSVYFLILFISFSACSQKKITFDDYTASIKEYQFDKNRDFFDEETSPLNKKDLKKFKGLTFFPIDSTYRIRAKFSLDKNPTLFEMPTTTDRKPLYKTYGIASFSLKGRELKLHIYQNQELIKKPGFENYLFIPYADKTNGIESYGGGRYIDVDWPNGDTIIIDFNKSYNPYCAYNDQYSCPIPPRENNLNIAINAGVKSFNK